MLIRSHDRPGANVDWRVFVSNQGFGHLAAGGGPERTVPVVVPTQFVLGDDEVILHLAAANPVFAAMAENAKVVLSVAGDWAYIPGQWKMTGDEDPALGVPTTYYAAVQIEATAAVTDDVDGIAAVLRTQLADLQPGEVESGALVDPLEHQKRYPAIRGVRLSIDDVQAKFKFGGNLDADHQSAIIDRLETRSGPGDAAAAAQARQVQD